jgi:hypothetical protein
MVTADTANRCAHAGCTCHVQGDEKYCSDSCARSAAGAVRPKNEGCECGHAACVASEYAVARPVAMASNS